MHKEETNKLERKREYFCNTEVISQFFSDKLLLLMRILGYFRQFRESNIEIIQYQLYGKLIAVLQLNKKSHGFNSGWRPASFQFHSRSSKAPNFPTALFILCSVTVVTHSGAYIRCAGTLFMCIPTHRAEKHKKAGQKNGYFVVVCNDKLFYIRLDYLCLWPIRIMLCQQSNGKWKKKLPRMKIRK